MTVTLILFATAVAAAITWCIWLERHPEVPADAEGHEGQPDSPAGSKGRT